ncbi:MAG: hypothetical protein OEZ44_00745 [Candidatus Bathyarchaeota archaeon]|nr:hypothetical protein [Candidatus Bathyarchaeota archaeon]
MLDGEERIRDELKAIYNSIGRKIRRAGASVINELNSIGYNPLHIDRSFTSMVEKWDGYISKGKSNKIRHKSIRSLVNIYILENIFSLKISMESKLIMILLESIINATDDIIDTTLTDMNERVDNAIIILFGSVFIQKQLSIRHSNLSIASRNDLVSKALFTYLLNISHIPIVEHQTYDTIIDSENETEIIEAAVKSYLWRAKDIDVFWEIACIDIGLDKDKRRKMGSLLRAFRAIELYYKDCEDLEYDLHHVTRTPMTALVTRCEGEDKKSLSEGIHRELSLRFDNAAKNVDEDAVISYLRTKNERAGN